jgi:hypothetical protein
MKHLSSLTFGLALFACTPKETQQVAAPTQKQEQKTPQSTPTTGAALVATQPTKPTTEEPKAPDYQAIAAPFIEGEDTLDIEWAGAFSPQEGISLIVVITFAYPKEGAVNGFYLTPDGKGSYQKKALPKLLIGGKKFFFMGTGTPDPVLMENLDEDPAPEILLGFTVQRTVGGENPHSYQDFEAVVLDWTSKGFARISTLEKKINQAIPDGQFPESSEALLQIALGKNP